ncbi:MAG: hypothetical protein JOZ77_11660 [Candidatus Eremiobacteraeota bacterium]|nr:hypothetical protein [Candidatus Eremiobacteraeota bacterium]
MNDPSGPPLAEFLLLLATDPETTEAFTGANAVGRSTMLADYGLSQNQIDAVLSCDPKILHQAVIEETGDLLDAIYWGKIRMFEIAFDAEE